MNADLPYIKLNVPINNLGSGQSVKVNLPDGLPIQEMILISNEQVGNNEVEIEVTTPQLLRGPAPRHLISNDLPPVPGKDNAIYYLTINQIIDIQHSIFEEALFKWVVPAKVQPIPKNVNYDTTLAMSGEFYPLNVKYKMLHFDGQKWNELPTLLDWCDKNGYCHYITDPSVGGYYAIVEEKVPTNSFTAVYVVIAVLFISLFVFYYITKKFKIKSKWKYIYYVAVILLIIIMASGLLVYNQTPSSVINSESNNVTSQTASPSTLGPYDNFAKCIKNSGAKLYSAFWCEFCAKQKELFGSSAQYLPYIECSNSDKTPNDFCLAQKVYGYPIWDFADGTRATGLQTLDQLSAKTGCKIN